MRLRGRKVNFQVLAECICCLLFGYLLLRLIRSGGYLNYVTPRMKPYLCGLSALMLLWALVNGRYLLMPRYRVKTAHTFSLIIPILLIVFLPAGSGGSSMIKSYGGGKALAAYERGGDAEPELYAKMKGDEETDDGAEMKDRAETDGGAADGVQQYSEEERPWYQLNGLDEAAKTITISDGDFYVWMYELSNFYEKYEGYTVVVKGFLYRDEELGKQYDFALVRLTMWCCAADLTPLGFFVDSGGTPDFKADEWLVVKGTLGIAADGQALILKAQSVEAAEKPEEIYVYPYF